VIRAHLSGETHIGLYPLLDGDLCSWLAADFDGPAAMLDALAYLKAARTWSVPAALDALFLAAPLTRWHPGGDKHAQDIGRPCSA
jgi:hypothetical protein